MASTDVLRTASKANKSQVESSETINKTTLYCSEKRGGEWLEEWVERRLVVEWHRVAHGCWSLGTCMQII